MADLTDLNNYLVPASGSVSGYPVRQVFSATPVEIDFRFVELDGDNFTPYGVWIDNSQGTGDLVIRIAGILGFSIVCPAGGRLAAPYPGPMNQQVSITGQGQADVTFVNFPVMPYLQEGVATLGNVQIANGDDVAEGNTADPIAVAPFSDPYTVISLLKAVATALITETAPTTGAMTTVALTGASQVIAAASARKGLIIFNDSTNVVFLRFEAAAASAANFSIELNPRDSLTLGVNDYTGEIRGFSAVATGNIRLTTLT